VSARRIRLSLLALLVALSAASTATHDATPNDVIGAACSFPPDTPVATTSGRRPISELEPGDLVWAYDPVSGAASARRVSAVSVHADEAVATLLLDGERLVTTPDHPVLTAGRGWVAAGELQAGETIRRLDGTTGTLFAVVVASRDGRMWDLTVKGVHTFAVGTGGWVVHNCAADDLVDLGWIHGAAAEDVVSAIPSNWKVSPTARGGGTRFADPDHPGDQIRLMPGSPNATDPLHSGPYAVVSLRGRVIRVPLEGTPTLKP
jgi:hypothetical protein